MVGEPQAETFQLVTVVSPVSCLNVCRTSDVVLPFQDDIHRQLFLVLVVDAQILVLFRLFLIDLYVLHREVGQILKHDFVLATEEVGTIQCQVVHLLAVDEDFPIIFQFHSRQLLDESVEHRPFRNIEGIGIEDKGVTTPHHFHFGCCNHHLIQVCAREMAGVWGFLQIDFRTFDFLSATAHLLHFKVGVCCLIIRVFKFDDISCRLPTDGKMIVGSANRPANATAIAVALPDTHRVNYSRVSTHQRHLHVADGSLGETIGHCSTEGDRIVLFLHLRAVHLTVRRHDCKGKEDGDDGLLDHFLLFNCYVPDNESTLTIALLKVEGGWRGVKRLEGEDEVGEE